MINGEHTNFVTSVDVAFITITQTRTVQLLNHVPVEAAIDFTDNSPHECSARLTRIACSAV